MLSVTALLREFQAAIWPLGEIFLGLDGITGIAILGNSNVARAPRRTGSCTEGRWPRRPTSCLSLDPYATKDVTDAGEPHGGTKSNLVISDFAIPDMHE